MTRKGAAWTQHEPGLARIEETADGTGRKARPAKNVTGGPGCARRIRERDGTARLEDGQPGAQPNAEAEVSALRAQWLETIRALARAAAQQDHADALRQRQDDANETGERG